MGDAAAHEKTNRNREATLYVVATPIGNLRDISLRALEVLKGADAIEAEYTRITRRLLAHYGIASRLIAVHEHNERRAVTRVLGLLQTGTSDITVRCRNSQQMAQALEAAGADVTLKLYRGAVHSDPIKAFSPLFDRYPVVEDLVDWLRAKL